MLNGSYKVRDCLVYPIDFDLVCLVEIGTGARFVISTDKNVLRLVYCVLDDRSVW